MRCAFGACFYLWGRMVEDKEKETPPLGTRIRALRTVMGLTQVVFAEVLGTHEASVARWEKNNTKPEGKAFEQMLRFAAEYNVLQEFAGGSADTYDRLYGMLERRDMPTPGYSFLLDVRVSSDEGMSAALQEIMVHGRPPLHIESESVGDEPEHTRMLAFVNSRDAGALFPVYDLKDTLKELDGVEDCSIAWNMRGRASSDSRQPGHRWVDQVEMPIGSLTFKARRDR